MRPRSDAVEQCSRAPGSISTVPFRPSGGIGHDAIDSKDPPLADLTDLGIASPLELVTIAKAVNEDRWIVGWSPNDHPLGLDAPFLWIDGTFHDLNDLVEGAGGSSDELAGVTVYRAHDVSDAGEILAELVHFSPLRFEDVLLVPED